jgi:hypothetical protein
MLTLVFGNKTKEDALAMRDLFCSSLVGIPGFIENEIMVSSSLVDKEGNTYPDGESIYESDDGTVYEHAVMLSLASDNQPEGTPDFVFTINCADMDITQYLKYLKK